MKDEDEIEDEINKVYDAKDEHPRGKWPGMTYEDGVLAAFQWVLEEREESPMED